MKVVGIIPARYQSSRFPGKPLALINGKPMIWWVYNQVKKVALFECVYVATDSQLIYDTCRENDIAVLMTSDQCRTGTDRLGEVAQSLDADVYVNIQGDEPMIEPETVEAVARYAMNHPEVKVVNTMTKLPEFEDVNCDTIVKVVAADNGDLIYLSRSPIPYPKKGQKIQYYRHLGLYGLSKDALMFYSNSERSTNEKIEDIEMLRFLENGYCIKIIEVPSATIGVDRPEDIEKVERVMKERGINSGI